MVKAVVFDEETPAAQWVDSTVQSGLTDPTSIRSAGVVGKAAQWVAASANAGGVNLTSTRSTELVSSIAQAVASFNERALVTTPQRRS